MEEIIGGKAAALNSSKLSKGMELLSANRYRFLEVNGGESAWRNIMAATDPCSRDATSAIDVEIEAKIHDALTKHLSGRTTILIAQRVSTISLADRVVLVEDGVVVADGTHSDLMANDHRYVSILAEAEKKQQD